MSYDIKIWSINELIYDEHLHKKGFNKFDNAYIYTGKDWQVVINNPVTVDDEDIPQTILGTLPGIQYFIEINIEPISVPQKAFQIAKTVSKYIAKQTLGIIVDEQLGITETASGIKRYNAPIKEKKNIMNMTWWFNDDTEFRKEGLKDFINLVDALIPEAMPRRFGLYEPPKYRYLETGKEHFISYMYHNLTRGVVWYPQKPFTHISVYTNNNIGPHRIGYRFGYISLEFYEEILNQPGWPLTLKRFWLTASDIINPIYGHIRKGENETVCWWNGIPQNLGVAVIIGKPYIDLISELVTKGSKTPNGLYYMETLEADFDEIVLNIDDKLIAPIGKKRTIWSLKADASPEEKTAFFAEISASKYMYPEEWPFDGPYK